MGSWLGVKPPELWDINLLSMCEGVVLLCICLAVFAAMNNPAATQ
jgi:hypothetical protein